ncbi:MAG: PEP-CTERM sorting domain-containing protein [Microcystis wesenbergii Mw_MB_S_20031200_S109]|uniref:PEP-CTERM sorting domain-containing protein n=1 Tax=Microcystis wesenbergii Mw_MB_S_20031200_S109D TaxID=2486241 RepID=A0A552M259_9CHRO|nr:MAG: PEP-CTERM sorting domain-containing protein [Microcystis wesenbergii Mw_MB_S_20031200_S109]TRV26540.1 MAG: PEP-CTERM sorting domain-containing protein [Microcystis wesenbergii Mw_MB_S_20031200_S109D]
MQNLLTKLSAATILAATLSSAIVPQAAAITFNFHWEGDAGYTMQGEFGYDETTAPTIISESGAGPTNVLDFLTVSFFNPSGNLTQSFNTVTGGISQSSFFEFNFNTTTHTLFGNFNVGGGTGVIGEQFFSGTIGGLLELRQDVDQISASNLLDSQNPGEITVKKTPEPSSMLGLLALGALGAGSMVNRKQQG